MRKNGGRFSFFACLGGCAKVEDVESPPLQSPERKKPTRQKSNTRLSCSDVSHTTDMSSLSSSLLGANLVVFTVPELKTATQGFSAANFIGEGGFGPVYKGIIDQKLRPSTAPKPQTVAVKVLNLDGMQGHKEWLTEVILLGQLRHPHLVKLIGYCYEEDHRMLVYEHMARGSLESHLFKAYSPLSWENRIKIAVGAAKGLAFLHTVDQPVIYRDFKASNILLDKEFKSKLSDFGLAKDGPEGDDTHVSTRVMGTHGYAAPEYVMTGHLTVKSDVYSFGVVLLEMLTGRRSVDKSRPSREQNLVDWARPYLNNPRKLSQIIDPRLEGRYSINGAQCAAELAYQCVSYLPKSRPDMSVVVEKLEPIISFKDIPPSTFVFTVKEKEHQEKETPPAKPVNEEKPTRQEDVVTPKQSQENNNNNNNNNRSQRKHTPEDVKSNNTSHRRHRHRKGGRRHKETSKKEAQSDTALYQKPSRQHRPRTI